MDINDLNINDMLKTSLKILKEMLSDRKIDTKYLNKITEEEIIKLFEENKIFDFKVNDNLKYNDIPEWDSIGHMALMAELESAFDITIKTDDLIVFESYKQGVDILSRYDIVVKIPD